MQKRHLSITHDLDRASDAGPPHAFDQLSQGVHDEFDLVHVQQTGRVENFDRFSRSNLRIGVKPSRLPGFGRLGLGGVSSGALLNIIHVGGWHHGWITSIDGKTASATRERVERSEPPVGIR